MTEAVRLILAIIEVFIMMFFVFMIGVKSFNRIEKYIDAKIDARLAQMEKND